MCMNFSLSAYVCTTYMLGTHGSQKRTIGSWGHEWLLATMRVLRTSAKTTGSLSQNYPLCPLSS